MEKNAIDFEKIILDFGAKGYDELFDKLWLNSADKIRKLEYLQSYAFIDGNEDFENKDYDKFLNFLAYFKKNKWGGVDNVNRLRFVEYPVDPYLEMEYYTYLINSDLGQKIRFTSDRAIFPKKVYDFVIFGNSDMFMHDFGNNDSFNGTWHVTNKNAINDVIAWFDYAFAQCKDFRSMLTPNSAIIEKMKEMKLF